MDKTTQRLARFAATTPTAGLPAEVTRAATRRLIDSVACAAAASPEPFCGRIRSFSARYSGTPTARIWGTGERTSLEMAAFANGTLLRYLDFSDTYMGRSNGHPSDMIGALVAVAEAQHLDGASLLAAIAVAYEVYCGLCASVPLGGHGIDQATCAAVGTAAGAGRLMGLSEARIGEALALGLAPNLHLYNVRMGTLSDWKGCAGPNGARNGLFAALLAQDGVTGPTAVVDGKAGLAELTEAFDWKVGGDRWHILDTHLKFHPVCYHGQSAIDAAQALRPQAPVESIDRIEVETYDASWRMMGSDPGRWAPANRETADHSLPYTIAVTLLEGRLTSSAYAQERLGDAATKRLMDRIRVSSSQELSASYPGRNETRVTIHLSDGRTLSHLQQWPKGHAANPLSDAELDAKFIDLYAPWGDAAAARRMLDLLWSAASLGDVATLVDALCP